MPSTVTYSFGAGATSATTSFQFVVPFGATPGSYMITVTDLSLNAGATTVTLTVNQPSFTATAIPNPLTLVIGGAAQNVTVSTQPDPGFNAGIITYSFSGFPAFIKVPPSQTSTADTNGFPPLTFTFSLNPGAVAGMYPGTLTGAPNIGAQKTFPFTIIVQQPDIGATFSNPSMTVCQGGATVPNTVNLTSINGYTGSPQVTFTSVPAGITINPINLPATVMPPNQSLPFNVSAAVGTAPGTYMATLNVSDPAANINKNVPLTITVTAPDYTPSTSPSTVNLTAGGGGQSITASIAPNACFTSSVSVSASAAPGIKFNPTSGPAPTTFLVQAASTVAPGTYTATFTFTPASGTTKTTTVTINVAAAPDFNLTVSPTSVSLTPGQSTSVTVSATGVNGFSGSISVTAPTIAGVTFSPAMFTLLPGGSQSVTVTAASNATPGNSTGVFSGTAPGIAGTRIAQLAVTILAGPDFSLSVNPSALTIGAGQTSMLTVTATGLNGFTGMVNVTAPMSADVTFTPATFTIPAGGSQTVTVTVSPTASPQTFNGVFTGTAVGIAGTHTAPVAITITAAPDFTLAVTPSMITIAQSGSAMVSVSATALNGFTGPITVTSLPSPGVLVSPAAFSLVPGTPVSVTVTVGTAVPLGAASVVFAGSSGTTSHSATLSISVSGSADFALSATPPAITVTAGSSGNVDVSVLGSNGFFGAVTVTSTAPPGVTLNPSTFMLKPGERQSVQVSVAETATPGAGTIHFVGNGSPTRTADVALNILPPRPVIVSVVPPAVATGDRSIVVRLIGRFFQSGARVSVANAGVRIENVNVLTPKVADVTLSVIAEAPVGATTLTLTNPDGGSAPIRLLVYPRGSIAAPLGVTTAAIVFPAEGTMIAPSQSVFPRGLLATTGTGTIIGTWKFDGVPFDRFTINVGGGYPAEVLTHQALPISFAGAHTLELEIDAPQFAVSPALHVIMAASSVSRLTLLAPRDGTIVGARPPLFRWSLVPNSSGYVVELDDAMLPKRIRISETQWQPSAETMQRLAPGIHRWRVRAVFPGETESEPTEWQRFAIVPQHVDLSVTSQQRHVRWTGGVAGLLYRVEVLNSAGKTIYSALTAANDFAIPPNISGTVRITALGPGGIVLGTSQTNVARASARAEIYLVQQHPTITNQEPGNGTKVATTQPHIGAIWSGAVKKEDVSMFVDETDVTAVATIDATSIAYDSLMPLGAGPHTVRLSLAGEVTTWSFEVEVPPAEAQVQPPSLHKDWALTPVGTITVISAPGQPDAARAQFSAQSDLSNDKSGAKVTGDTSLRHDLNNPNKTVQESRNWLTDFTHQQSVYQGEAKIGYAAPDFTDQSELLATGVARGGVEGRVHFSNKIIASLYETFGTRPAGVVAGDFGPKQTIRAAALQTAPNDKWDFRVIAFRVHDDPGPNSAGGLGKAVGIFAKYVFDPKLTAIFEGSHGEFDPNTLGGAPKHAGNALRLDFSGVAGTLTYTLNLRRTEANFVNPSNRGFTPGGVPDRTGGNLSITKVINRTSISVQLRTLRDGNSSGAVLPRNRENGGTLSIATGIGQNTTLALGGNWTADHGSGNPSLSLPNLDRTQSGANGTLTEAFGRLNLSQNVTVQKLHDRINPISDSTTSAGTLTFGGAPTTNINLQAVLSGTRSAGSSTVGNTDQFLVSLQPSYTIPNLGLMLQPRANFNRSKSSLTNIESRTEQYQGLVTWAPARVASLFSLQFSADAMRNRSTGQVPAPKFIHQYVGTLSLKWGAGSGASMNGTTVVNAQTDVAATNTNNPTTTSAKSQ